MLEFTLVTDPIGLRAVVVELCRRVAAAARCKSAFQRCVTLLVSPVPPPSPTASRVAGMMQNVVKAGEKPCRSRRTKYRQVREQRHPECAAAAGRCPFRCPSRRCSDDETAELGRACSAARLGARARSPRRAPRPRAVAVHRRRRSRSAAGAADDGSAASARRLRKRTRRRRCATCGASRRGRRAGSECASRIIFARRGVAAPHGKLGRAGSRGAPRRRGAAVTWCDARAVVGAANGSQRARRGTASRRPTTSPSPRGTLGTGVASRWPVRLRFFSAASDHHPQEPKTEGARPNNPLI